MAKGMTVGDQQEPVAQPYPPSWVDRTIAYVKRLPGPSWRYYLAMGLVLLLLQMAILWGEGARAAGSVVPSFTFLTALAPLFLALFEYLDDRAAAALATLQPVLEASKGEYEGLRYRLTTLPAGPTLLASLAGAAFMALTSQFLGTPADYAALAPYPASAVLIYGLYLLTWWVAGAFMFHTIHQLSLINLIYSEYASVNLFFLRPLYAFSGVTAATAVSLAGVTYGWYVLNPELLSERTAIAMSAPIPAVALAAFVWPLLGIHRLLVEEKERALDEVTLRIQAAIAKLHGLVDSGKLEETGALGQAIAILKSERDMLASIPTWPWQPETVRLLVSALALPLALRIAQSVLERLLGP